MSRRSHLPPGLFSCPGGGELLDEERQWEGILCEACEPRAAHGDGRICRACAARLAQVRPDTMSSWITRGYVTDVRYEGRRPLLMPAEVILMADKLHKRERTRMTFLLSGLPDMEGVA